MEDVLDLGSLLPDTYSAPEVSSVLGDPLEAGDCSPWGSGPHACIDGSHA